MRAKTRLNGEKTASHTRFSPLTILNKDPDYDYSFRRRKDVEDGGGVDYNGYEPITSANSNGEVLGGFQTHQSKTKGREQLVYLDTVACKRHKDISKVFKIEEDERYNAQVMHVQNASRRTREALRDLDPDSVVTDKSEHVGPSMTQRKGLTEVEHG